MFLGLLVPDPDPLVRGTDPDPSFIMQNTGSYKNVASKSTGNNNRRKQHEPNPGSDPEPIFRGTNPRIRTRKKMSWIRIR